MPWGVPESEIDAAAQQLGLSAVENAFLNQAGELVLMAGGQAYTVPAPAAGKTDTLPRAPHQRAQMLTEVKPAESAPSADSAKPNSVRPLTGGSVPPNSSDPCPEPGPEPPSDPRDTPVSGPARNSQSRQGLDDFTAIHGVGPVTAQKLHDLGLFTYDDIREWEGHLDDHLPHHVAVKIQQWLDKHLT